MADDKQRPKPPRVTEPDQKPSQKPITEGVDLPKSPRVIQVGDSDTVKKP